MSRLGRKNRTDIIIKSSGGMSDLFDNVIKEAWRINDEEFDFIIEDMGTPEMDLFISESLNFSDAKRMLNLVDSKLITLYKDK